MLFCFARAFFALLILAGFSGAGSAGPVGAEFKVNKTTASEQSDPVVADLADGGFVVTWTSQNQDGSGTGVYAQRYDAAGKRVGTREFKVNKTTADNQDQPDVAGLGDGGFIIAWRSYGQDGSSTGIFAQRYDAAGKRVGTREFQVNKTTTGGQEWPRIAGLADGSFVIVWQSLGQDGDASGVYGQRYDAAGKRIGNREFKVNKTTASRQELPCVAALADGGFVVGWQSYSQDGSGWGVYGQRYDAAGKRAGTREFKVNKTTAANQYTPEVTGLTGGGYTFAWAANGQDESGYGVYAQRYDAAGKRAGKREFQVNKYESSGQDEPDISGVGDGGFVVAWQSYAEDGNNYGVFGQRYDAAGKRVGSRGFQVNTYTEYQQIIPSVAGLAGGGFVFTWASWLQDGSGTGVYGQRYEP